MPDTKKYLSEHLPPRLADALIAGGKIVKKRMRLLGRHMRHGKGAVIRTLSLNGVTFSIELRPYENGCVDESIAEHGVWEPDLAEQILQHVHRGDTFVDIGANIGYHTLLVAAHLSGTGKVHAFEPVPRIARQIERSVRLNGFSNVIVHAMGLGNQAADQVLHMRDENMGGSSIGLYQDLPLVTPSGMQPITIRRLDEVLDPQEKINVIKIDVEGYELEALQGAHSLLVAHRPSIFMEFSPVFYEYDRPGKSLELISYLEGLGYGFCAIDGQPLNIRTWLEVHKSDATPQLDVLCRV